MNVRLAWSTNQVPKQPGLLHKETLSQTKKKEKKEEMTNKWISDKEVQQRKAGCCSLKKKPEFSKLK